MSRREATFMFFMGLQTARIQNQFGRKPVFLGGLVVRDEDAISFLATLTTATYIVSLDMSMPPEARKAAEQRVIELTQNAIVEYDFYQNELEGLKVYPDEQVSNLAKRILVYGTNVRSTT